MSTRICQILPVSPLFKKKSILLFGPNLGPKRNSAPVPIRISSKFSQNYLKNFHAVQNFEKKNVRYFLCNVIMYFISPMTKLAFISVADPGISKRGVGGASRRGRIFRSRFVLMHLHTYPMSL